MNTQYELRHWGSETWLDMCDSVTEAITIALNQTDCEGGELEAMAAELDTLQNMVAWLVDTLHANGAVTDKDLADMFPHPIKKVEL